MVFPHMYQLIEPCLILFIFVIFMIFVCFSTSSFSRRSVNFKVHFLKNQSITSGAYGE